MLKISAEGRAAMGSKNGEPRETRSKNENEIPSVGTRGDPVGGESSRLPTCQGRKGEVKRWPAISGGSESWAAVSACSREREFATSFRTRLLREHASLFAFVGVANTVPLAIRTNSCFLRKKPCFVLRSLAWRDSPAVFERE